MKHTEWVIGPEILNVHTIKKRRFKLYTAFFHINKEPCNLNINRKSGNLKINQSSSFDNHVIFKA